MGPSQWVLLLEIVQHKDYIAITVAIQGISHERLHKELGLEFLIEEDGFASLLYQIVKEQYLCNIFQTT